jgi:hypothetical protein
MHIASGGADIQELGTTRNSGVFEINADSWQDIVREKN